MDPLGDLDLVELFDDKNLRIQTPPDRAGLMVNTSHPQKIVGHPFLGHTWILKGI